MTSSAPREVGGSPPTAPVLGSRRPNIVFVLTDDMSSDLAGRHADLDSARSPHHDHRQRATNPFEEVIS
jgi:hypothetical protein